MSCDSLPLFESVKVYLTPCLSVFGTPLIENSFSVTLIGVAALLAAGATSTAAARASAAVRRMDRIVSSFQRDARTTRRQALRFVRAGRRPPQPGGSGADARRRRRGRA